MTKPGVKHISYWDLIKDSIKYALSDWVAILIFGVILLVLSTFENYVLVNFEYLFSKRLIVAIIIVISLSLLESGYSFKILEESIHGSKKPPLFAKYKEMYVHGFKDVLVSIFYLGIIFLIIVFAYILDIMIPNGFFLITSIALLLSGVILLFMLGAFLNLVYTGGEFKSAFDFKKIKKILSEIGYFRLFVVYVFGLISEYLIVASILHIGIFAENSILSFLVNLLLTPFIVIFTERLFALSSL